jgi:methionyl-tRNA formyltransferase
VSCGLKVPSRILSAAQYGGLNVHPSILPDFRGAAPIHHTLLHRLTHTGVTVQTLHPHIFDGGEILLQKRDIPIPEPDQITPEMLAMRLAPLGGDLLVEVLRKQLYLDTARSHLHAGVNNVKPGELRLAPKIKPQDRMILWHEWTFSKILTYQRVLGNLWDTSTFSKCCRSETSNKRVIFHELRPVQSTLTENKCVGNPFLDGGKLFIKTAPDKDSPEYNAVEVLSCTVENESRGNGVVRLKRLLEDT